MAFPFTKSILHKLWNILLIIALEIGATATAMAQHGTLDGRVIDINGNGIYAATIIVEGSTLGSVTDFDGNFSISNINSGNIAITIHSIGYETKKLTATIAKGNKTSIGTITLNEASQEIDEVAVVGKSMARQQQEIAFAVSVVDLSKSYSSAATLKKAIGNNSSVRVREDGGLGSTYSFSINGFSGNQVKFFLDGIPMDNFGSSFNIGNLPPNIAERVDIYKGVLPVELCSDALGGAVNIVSRRNANYLDASYSIGSFGTHKANLSGALTSQSGFTLRLNVFGNRSDNDYKVYVQVVDLATGNKSSEKWVRRFADEYKSVDTWTELGIVNKPWADMLLAGIIASANDKQIQTGATMDAVYGGVKTTSSTIISTLRYKKDDIGAEGLSLSLFGTWGKVSTYYVDTLARRYNWEGEWIEKTSRGEFSLADTHIDSHEGQLTTTLSYIITEHQSLTINNSLSTNRRTSCNEANADDPMNNIPQRLTKNISAVGYKISFDRWNANLFLKNYHLHSSTQKQFDIYTDNARWERVSDDKNNLGYGLATTWFVTKKLQAKVSYENACRMPEANELFGDGLIQESNTDLRPEKSHNLNVGIGYCGVLANVHRLTLDANYIFRNAEDFIRKGVSLSNNPTTSYDNLGKVRTQGVELGATYTYKIVHVGGGFTFQDIIDNARTVKTEGSYVGASEITNITYKQRLPNIPYLFANGEAGVKMDNIGGHNITITADYNFNYVYEYYLSFPGLGSVSSKKVIPMQISHDIAIGASIANGRYNIVAECNNVANAKLYDNYKLQKPGRNFSIKLRYYISK